MSNSAYRQPIFGRLVRAARSRRAWSRETFAEKADIALGTLKDIETGKRHPRHQTVQKIAQALGLPPETFAENCDSEEATEALSHWQSTELSGNLEDAALSTRHHNVLLTRIMAMMKRRDVMQTLATAVFAGIAGADNLRAEPNDAMHSVLYGLGGKKVGGEVVNWAREQVATLNRLDVRIGGGQLYAVAQANLELLHSLLRMRAARGSDERELRLALAHMACLAGWFAEDTMNFSQAKQYYHLGMEVARSAEDMDLVTYSLTRLATVELAEGNPGQCLSQLEAAETGIEAKSPWRSFILTYTVEAQGRSGDCGAAGRTLAKADTLYDRRRTDLLPAWAFWVSRPSSSAIAPRAFIQHDPRFAVRLCEEALAQTPVELARARLLQLAGLAKAKLALGETDEAVGKADVVLQAVTMNAMPRVEKLLTEFHARLPDDPLAHPFKARFAEYERARVAA